MEEEEISLDTPLGAASSQLLVEMETGLVLIDRAPTGHTCTLTAYLPDGRKVITKDVPRERSLRQAVAAAASSRPLRAFHAGRERVVAHHRFWATAANVVPFAVGCAAGFAGIILVDEHPWTIVLLIVGILTVVVAQHVWSRTMRFRQWQIVRGDERLSPEELPLPPLKEEADVDDVKAEYGRLLSDIAYRIEFPALFDPQEPTSKAFTLALLQWDNNDGIITADERHELAARVRATFQAARANAERLGMDYLPDEVRDRAGTALKAARLAADEHAADAERTVALTNAVRILDELGLYYLPSGGQARKAILGHAPLALPGRRSR